MVGLMCIVDGCEKEIKRLGKYCEAHYYRIRRHGSTEDIIPSDMRAGAVFENSIGLKLAVVKYNKSKSVSVKFLDSGFETDTHSDQIRKGNVKDKLHPSVFGVGFIGDGIYKTTIGRDHTEAYKKWIQMMRRCYSDEYHKSKPTYRDCEVCEEWQDFQCFAEWFYDNYPSDGISYDLDKDLKVKGNRVYSPETCLFLTQTKHLTNSTEHAIEKDGVIYKFTNISKFANKNGLDSGGLSRLLNGKAKTLKGYTKHGS